MKSFLSSQKGFLTHLKDNHPYAYAGTDTHDWPQHR